MRMSLTLPPRPRNTGRVYIDSTGQTRHTARRRRGAERSSRKAFSTRLPIPDAARVAVHLAISGENLSAFMRRAILAALPPLPNSKDA